MPSGRLLIQNVTSPSWASSEADCTPSIAITSRTRGAPLSVPFSFLQQRSSGPSKYNVVFAGQSCIICHMHSFHSVSPSGLIPLHHLPYAFFPQRFPFRTHPRGKSSHPHKWAGSRQTKCSYPPDTTGDQKPPHAAWAASVPVSPQSTSPPQSPWPPP